MNGIECGDNALAFINKVFSGNYKLIMFDRADLYLDVIKDWLPKLGEESVVLVDSKNVYMEMDNECTDIRYSKSEIVVFRL